MGYSWHTRHADYAPDCSCREQSVYSRGRGGTESSEPSRVDQPAVTFFHSQGLRGRVGLHLHSAPHARRILLLPIYWICQAPTDSSASLCVYSTASCMVESSGATNTSRACDSSTTS